MIRNVLKQEIGKAIKKVFTQEADFSVEVPASPAGRPANSERGDYSSNVALILAGGAFGKPEAFRKPTEVAEKIKSELEKSETIKKYFSKIEIAPPGFLNFWISENALIEELKKLDLKLTFGKGQKIQVEFISANPTGALHIGHLRSAFYGDALSNILEAAGYKVEREYFINDSKESTQIKELGKTVLGQGTSYLTERLKDQISNLKNAIQNLKQKNPENLFGQAGYLMAKEIQKDNQKFIEKGLGIKFDKWFSEEKELRKKKEFAKTIKALEKKNLTYRKDGAWWLKTAEFGDDEDRVLLRSDGAASYFLSDIAYHLNKFKRGFKKIINIWGADHQGHVKRMQSVKKIFDWPGELKILISQLVTIKEAGQVKKLSKRKGDVILAEDLLKEVGLDATRWFFLEKSLNTHMEFDLALAKERSEKNPVFYVQYAGARIHSILTKSQISIRQLADKSLPRQQAGQTNSKSQIPALPASRSNLKQLNHQSELALIKKLIQFPEVIEDIAKDYQVHRFTNYVYQLATIFNIFYRDVKVLGSGENESARLALVFLTRQILEKCLKLLGISAPEKM